MAEAPDGRLLLWEATTLDSLPCAIQGKPVSGFQAHPIDAVLERYCGKVWLYPLYRELYEAESRRLTAWLFAQIGKGYDEIAAIRAAGLGFSWLESKLHPENLHSLFCSEVCAAAYREIGLMPTRTPGGSIPITWFATCGGTRFCGDRSD